MLSEAQTIDIVIPIDSEVLMLVISDMHPWSDPDSNERFGQYMEKLQSYSRYVADDAFESKHPGVPPTSVVISFVSNVPASARMRRVRAVQCEKNGSNNSIVVTYADETPAVSDSEGACSTADERPTARSMAKHRLLVRGWIIAAIGVVPMFAAQLLSQPELKRPVADTIMSICFWGGALTLAVGSVMVLWSQQEW